MTVVWHVAMSLDGFTAGPDHDMSWTEGAEYDTSDPVAAEVAAATGAILAGRRWYDVATALGGAVAGIYGGAWSGPVLVLTHEPEQLAGDPSVQAVTDLEPALAQAEALAGRRAVGIFGSDVARQVLALGRVDEIVVHVIPVLLGGGVRLLDDPAAGPRHLERTHLAAHGGLTDMRFRVSLGA
jgi:dihydrofolate reductase